MKRTFLAALLAAIAVGCAPSSVEPVSDNSAAAEPAIMATDADSNLTLVTLEVPGMT